MYSYNIFTPKIKLLITAIVPVNVPSTYGAICIHIIIYQKWTRFAMNLQAESPGHHYPQRWINVNCTGPVSYRNILQLWGKFGKIKLWFEKIARWLRVIIRCLQIPYVSHCVVEFVLGNKASYFLLQPSTWKTGTRYHTLSIWLITWWRKVSGYRQTWYWPISSGINQP